MNKLQVNNYWF